MGFRIKFTWKKLAEILRWILPIISSSKEANAMEAPKGGMLTAPTITTKAANLVPGAVASGIAPHTQVTVEVGTKFSIAKLVGFLIVLIGTARTIGDLTGKWHIPIGTEDQVGDVANRIGSLWESILLILSGLGLHAVRSALPPTQK